jgi:hypothetical protein
MEANMALLAEAIRSSATQTARYHGQETNIEVQQISGRSFGDNQVSFAVKALHGGSVARFDAEDLRETFQRLLELGVPEVVVLGSDWQAIMGPGGIDPQAPAHAW